MELPKIVLPKVSNILKGPNQGLAEIRQTLNQTAVNFEAKMPTMGGKSLGRRLPRMSPMVKSFEERMPFRVPSLSSFMVKKVESPLITPKVIPPSSAPEAPKVLESISKITENPEGLRTQVPGMSSFTTQHLTQGTDMQGARGSL